jgi:hypothetical protein
MLKEPPSFDIFFLLRISDPPEQLSKLNMSENSKTEFENILGYETWAHMGLVHEKNKGNLVPSLFALPLFRHHM